MRSKANLASVLALAILVASGCSEANRDTAAVQLIATTTQDVLIVDLRNPPAAIGTINISAIEKNQNATGPTDPRYLDVRLRSYRVSYRRTDGGTQVPAPFVRTLSGIVAVGGASQALNDFFVLDNGALSQAPFAALFPQNGGRDPETGSNIVKLDVITEIFGETLAGDDVYARVTSPLWVCVGCQ